MKHFIIIFISLFFAQNAISQQVAKSVGGDFALVNAKIFTVTNGTLENASLLIQDGKISAIGENVTIPGGVKSIDCEGLSIYPGFIDSGTRLGLSEIGSVSLTQDYNEIGNFTPHLKALTAVNPNSVLIPVTRVNGITTVLAMPGGGRFPGIGAVINLHGYTPEQMSTGVECHIMNYPSTGKRGRWDRRSEEDRKKDEDKALKSLNDTWNKLALFHRIDSTAKADGETYDVYNPEMRALLPIIRKEAPLFVEVNGKSDILSAIKWIEEKGIKAVLTGVSEGWRVADKIAESKIPVITGPILRVPGRSSDAYDVSYKNAGIMAKAGVIVSIRTMETENVRNLPYNAGFAAAYGMGTEEALKAITINPATTFGLDDKIGSLEVGKHANLFVSTGDPFETKTDIKHLFINGYMVPLESRHTLLYDEFLKRNPGLDK